MTSTLKTPLRSILSSRSFWIAVISKVMRLNVSKIHVSAVTLTYLQVQESSIYSHTNLNYFQVEVSEIGINFDVDLEDMVALFVPLLTLTKYLTNERESKVLMGFPASIDCNGFFMVRIVAQHADLRFNSACYLSMDD